MIRYILTNKWIMGSMTVFTCVVVSCIFWYNREIISFKKELEKSNELIAQNETPLEEDTLTIVENTDKLSDVSNNDIFSEDIEVTDEDIENLLKEIADEKIVSEELLEKLFEEMATLELTEKGVSNDLSPEENANQERQRKVKELFDKISKIIQEAGGRIHSSSHPEEVQEIVNLLEEASGGTTIFTQMHNFGMMFKDSVSENGDVKTSELLRMAEHYESDMSGFGPIAQQSAETLRNMALYATIKGYEVINLQEIANSHDDIEKVLTEYYENND
ncbi:hypothetical protein C6497_06755 [Candidatus Poribacteria bacterium]|nr:MAG: hypothetical protein C6497_06755 [Candidatus Poribacteria bacterium]